jgi:hypothetical protein
VHLEPVEGGIMIRPAKTGSLDHHIRTQADEISTPADQAEQKGLRSWWKQISGGGRAKR